MPRFARGVSATDRVSSPPADAFQELALFDGFAMNLVGFAFELDVQPATAARGAALAFAIGLIGGLLPARAASRLEIVEALRHL